jgi:hypothetical protein
MQDDFIGDQLSPGAAWTPRKPRTWKWYALMFAAMALIAYAQGRWS